MFTERDYFEIGTTPCDEDCAQVGKPDYYNKVKIEAIVYIKMIGRLFPEQVKDSGISLRLKSFPHDFGTYHEVCVGYEVSFDEDEDGETILTSSEKAALEIEGNIPESWDEEALQDLHSLGYFNAYMEMTHVSTQKEKMLKKA